MRDLIKAPGQELLIADQYSATDLIIPPDLSWDAWVQKLQAVQLMAQGHQWWLGLLLDYGELRWGEKYAQAAEDTGYKPETCRKALYVYRRVQSGIRIPELEYSHHVIVAPLEPDQQREILAKALAEGMTVRDTKIFARRVKCRGKYGTPGEAGPLPDGPFRVVYADPPWPYGNEMIAYPSTPADHYEQLTLEGIIQIMQGVKFTEDGVLLIWVPAPLLRSAFTVIDAIGLTYKTQFIWNKLLGNIGYYVRVKHENLLIATRGACTPEGTANFDSVYVEKRTTHSAKPVEFRNMIDQMYPHGERLEMFARGKAPKGWNFWGDEANQVHTTH